MTTITAECAEEQAARRLLDAMTAAGHGACAGFTFDSRDPSGQVTCSCGAVITVGAA
jgi:hypothetical protein